MAALQRLITSTRLKIPRKIFSASLRTTTLNIDDRLNVVTAPTDVNPVDVTIPEFLWANLSKWENAPAFQCGVTGRKYSHLEIYKYSRGFATALREHGINRGDRVAILLPNFPEYAIAILGILEAGIVPSPFNPSYTSDEVAAQIKACEAKSIITIPELLPVVTEAKKSASSLKSIICLGNGGEDCVPFFDMMKVTPNEKHLVTTRDSDVFNDIALLPWSSGTTGLPKGVVLTHSSIATNVLQLVQPGVLATEYNGGPRGQDRFIGILPFFHIYGFTVVMAKTLCQGSFTVTLPKFDPPTFLSILRSHKPTFLHLVPPLISFMGSHPDVTEKDFESIVGIMGGAAPIGLATIEKLFEKSGKQLLFQEGYGMTELSPVSHLTPKDANNTKLGSCGIPLPSTQCKIIDQETGETLGPNMRGELCVKGPQVMKEYYHNEKATNDTIDKDGWLHTGDISMFDNEGYFYIVDRLKELIKVRGFQVAPSELEDLLRKCPNVADVAVIGVPDERSGELPRAYIVPSPNMKNTDEQTIHKFLEPKIAPHKKLKGGVEFVEAIPKAASGKILRRELKKSYLEKSARS